MKISEDVFRHEVLDTTVIDYFLNLKSTFDFCRGVQDPLICGVFPADETPSQNFNLLESQDISWVSNIDPSTKPGRHWVSILRNLEKINSASCNMAICRKATYYVVDSWGYKDASKSCEYIINTLNDNFMMANFNHANHMALCGRRCKCQFEISLPVRKRIQHETFENCGWYAIRFCDMNKEQLIEWMNSDYNDYAQIKNNYKNIVKYFTEIFFPNVIHSSCVDYVDFKMKKLFNIPRCKNNQICENRKCYYV